MLCAKIAFFAYETLFAGRREGHNFRDLVLPKAVMEAVSNNSDLCIAVRRVLQPRARVGIIQPHQFSSLNAWDL
jgi:hypothetical protein